MHHPKRQQDHIAVHIHRRKDYCKYYFQSRGLPNRIIYQLADHELLLNIPTYHTAGVKIVFEGMQSELFPPVTHLLRNCVENKEDLIRVDRHFHPHYIYLFEITIHEALYSTKDHCSQMKRRD